MPSRPRFFTKKKTEKMILIVARPGIQALLNTQQRLPGLGAADYGMTLNRVNRGECQIPVDRSVVETASVK